MLQPLVAPAIAPVLPRLASGQWASCLPGLGLTAALAVAAYLLRLLPGVGLFSPMILAVLLGALLHNAFGSPATAAPGVGFALKRLLRFAIVLLGLQITARQAALVGGEGLAMIAVGLLATLAFTLVLGRWLGVTRGLALLIGAGTAICGASAVLAAKAATGGKDEDAAYAVACVTLFGTAAMLLYPLLGAALHLDPRAYGIWAGASIHEIAQAVAAAGQNGAEALQMGAIAKLARVAMMAPLVIALGEWGGAFSLTGGEARQRPPFPWFLVGFLALATLNSLFALPPALTGPLNQIGAFMLCMAMAAMGLQTDLRQIRAAGLKPLALGLCASLFIAGFTLLWVEFVI